MPAHAMHALPRTFLPVPAVTRWGTRGGDRPRPSAEGVLEAIFGPSALAAGGGGHAAGAPAGGRGIGFVSGLALAARSLALGLPSLVSSRLEPGFPLPLHFALKGGVVGTGPAGALIHLPKVLWKFYGDLHRCSMVSEGM